MGMSLLFSLFPSFKDSYHPPVPEHPIFARVYDRLMAGTEKAGLSEKREKLLAEARGRTLELGAGTGLNLSHYTDAVSELVLAEPEAHMATRLRARLEEEPPAVASVEVIEAPAEDLPFDDASFDTVVATLVFCTVADPARAMAEAKRVLADGGALLFMEHVRADSRRLARFQDLIERPWGFFAGGCHPNRRTAETIAESGFWVERLDRGVLPKAPPPARPLITGVARRPSGATAPEY
jgi:ubiquinone/menaquinone biosynthesis C-methylase UbiE